MDDSEIEDILRQLQVLREKMANLDAEQQALKRRLDVAIENRRAKEMRDGGITAPNPD